MGCLLKDAISCKISGVKTPPTAAAPVNELLATDCTTEADKFRFSAYDALSELTVSGSFYSQPHVFDTYAIFY